MASREDFAMASDDLSHWIGLGIFFTAINKLLIGGSSRLCPKKTGLVFVI
jgi:hypothetical protein